MRISSVEKNILSPAFKGYKSVKDNMGKNIYEFNFPFDENAKDSTKLLFKNLKDRNIKNHEVIEKTAFSYTFEKFALYHQQKLLLKGLIFQ